MNNVVEWNTAEEESLRRFAIFGYAAHLVGLVTIVGFIVGLIFAYIKREDARGTIYESHFRWQTRSFWWFVLWFVLLLAPTVLTLGFIPFFIIAQVWLAYRMIKGWLRAVDRRAIA